jgi:hypothetical protein
LPAFAVAGVIWWLLLRVVFPPLEAHGDGIYEMRSPWFMTPTLALLLSLVTVDVVERHVLARFSPRFAAALRAEVMSHQQQALIQALRNQADVIYAVVALIVLLFAWGLSRWYWYVGPSSIVIHPFWSLHSRTYSYEDVAWIGASSATRAPSGNVNNNGWREFAFRFRDGTVWSTVYLHMSAADKSRVSAYISERSGTPVTEVPILERRDI